MSVTPLHPNVRYYCSDCDEHYHEHERAKHEKCCPHVFCTGCGFALSDGDDENCQRCGTSRELSEMIAKKMIHPTERQDADGWIVESENPDYVAAGATVEEARLHYWQGLAQTLWLRSQGIGTPPSSVASLKRETPSQLYLVRKNAASGRPAHIWTGKDTQCRMASTGGLSIRKYTVIDQLGDRPICQNCINVGASQS